MEIPQDVQDKLKCSECDELLSCGPVYLLHETGGAICGRCSQQPDKNDSTEIVDRTRIGPYEATASLLAFPCAFSARGCPEKIKFSLGQPPHELICKFRPLICPIAPRGSCDWIGSLSKLRNHCYKKHPLNFLKNPCNPPRPDLTTSNLQTYLISAFRFLFLLQIKVCVTSGKLFHSLRMFENSTLLEKFSYSLEIEGNNKKITDYGSVLRAGILTIQEPTAICTTINNLLGILDGKYNESKFTIRIEALFKFCLKCLKHIENDFDSKFCEECEEKLVKCDFNENGCSFVDFDSGKCLKHESYFCKYQTECFFCEENFVGGSCIEHLCSSTSHEIIKSNINSVVRITPNPNPNSDSDYNFIVFSSNIIGTIMCDYKLTNLFLELNLSTSLLLHELKYYKCSIILTDPQTKHTKILTPRIKYDEWDDWLINEEMNNFPSWENIGIDLKVNIEKI